MTEPVLRISGITKSFGALRASEDVTLDLCAGEIHALIGPNGAGKSTLIAQIAGALAPDSGTIKLEGRDVTAQSTVARARAGLARTFQISSLAMEDTVLQNAMLGALGARQGRLGLFGSVMRDTGLRETARAALDEVGLGEFAGFRVGDLSHGQRRQLEVAVALTLKPRVLLMDEPMAGLGAEGTAQMVPMLQRLKHTAPILLIEHDMDAVFQLADRISVLVYGQIIATDAPDAIRTDPRVREAYLGDDLGEDAV
ncbi:ABC transporter ATP-binding protein [Rhodalgimonas zhirmunskyi]|uniref:ABC transporter ATP-binding protein n=1 Tax=Rhodalgimonas zhirmunskyi TaxID=2964767 RepID=A0AAJ1X4N9_9RHOB|nr:ABC transporter ATP-binding protein [Rhodoalgimonas zhirmunskyi]MDQ2092709.1 ABC transporter ATP-binding protein [Rhodoalgimonas zhirmunskyi]